MKENVKRRIQAAGTFLFILYLVLLIYFLFFDENFGRTGDVRRYSYNLKPFREIGRFWIQRKQLGFEAVFVNIAGNVLCFIPFGAILPVLNRRMRGFFAITLFGFEFSLLVELLQFMSMTGSFDVDDIALNTLGSALGFLIFAVCDRLRRERYG